MIDFRVRLDVSDSVAFQRLAHEDEAGVVGKVQPDAYIVDENKIAGDA